jgi:ABC-type transport system involved in cytochrome bd biosynthesis fused ATPase/permease subunit
MLTHMFNSALLLALLGEMSCISGTVHLVKQPHQMDDHGLHNTVAYAAQTPWLQNGTIRDAM